MRYRSKTLFPGLHSRPHTPLCPARPCPAPLTAYSCHRSASRICCASWRGGEVAQCNSCRRGCANQVRGFRVPEAFVRSASRVRMEAQGQADLLLLSSMSHRASSRKRVVCPSPVRVLLHTLQRENRGALRRMRRSVQCPPQSMPNAAQRHQILARGR